MAQILLNCVLSKAAVAAPNERFPDPDSVYIDVYDVNEGQASQLTARAGSGTNAHALVARLQEFFGQIVVIVGHLTIRQRQGGGSLVNIHPDFEVLTPLAWEERQQTRRKS